MNTHSYAVLFLCTANSARSQMAEALLNALAKGRMRAFSAGSHPALSVHPLAQRLIAELGSASEDLRTKSWNEFAVAGAPTMDFVITVCDTAAGEVCPVWPGHPVLAHWGMPDPARSPNDAPQAFRDAWLGLRRRVELLLALPLDKLDRLAQENGLREIAGATESIP